MGRAYFAVQDEAARKALFDELGKEQGAALVESARHAIADFARDGCCYSFREWHDDVNAIAAPFRDVRNGRWLVLSSSGPASSMNEAFFRETIGPKLKALAARVSHSRSSQHGPEEVPQLGEQHDIEHLTQIRRVRRPARALLHADDALHRRHIAEAPLPEHVFEIDEFFGHFIKLPVRFRIAIDGEPRRFHRRSAASSRARAVPD